MTELETGCLGGCVCGCRRKMWGSEIWWLLKPPPSLQKRSLSFASKALGAGPSISDAHVCSGQYVMSFSFVAKEVPTIWFEALHFNSRVKQTQQLSLTGLVLLILIFDLY